MTKLLILPCLGLVLVLLSACESEPVEKTVWDDQVQALDKARQVEGELMQRANQLSKDLEYPDDTEKKKETH